MHSVIETAAYIAAADDTGMKEDERNEVVTHIASDPQAGAIMPGCGGARKLRVRKLGTGKSGGYRVITYYAGADVPVFLLTVFAKGEKDSLDQRERNQLAALTKLLNDGLTRRKGRS